MESTGYSQKIAKRRSRSKARPSNQKPKRTNGLDEGTEFEYRVGRVEFAEGAFVRVRVPVHASSEAGKDVVTDIDVLALDVDLRLRLRRSILECKSRRGQAGEPDRLFWLEGLRLFVGAERAVLARGTSSKRGTAIAQQLGLHLLDEKTLAVREAANAWLPRRFAHLGGEECLAAEIRTDTQLKAFGEMPKSLIRFLRFEALLESSHMTLGALMTLRSSVESVGILPEPAGTVMAAHSLTALIVTALRDSGMAETLPNAELQRRLELALTTGSPDDDHVLNVLSQADEFLRHEVERVHMAYQVQGGKRLVLNTPSLRDLVSQPPPWIPRYIDLVDRFRANPSIARDLLQTVELSCFDALVGGSAWESPAFDHLFTRQHRNLIVAAMKMLQEIAGPIADRLEALGKLAFDRRAPDLPDRRQPSEPLADNTARLAIEEGPT